MDNKNDFSKKIQKEIVRIILENQKTLDEIKTLTFFSKKAYLKFEIEKRLNVNLSMSEFSYYLNNTLFNELKIINHTILKKYIEYNSNSFTSKEKITESYKKLKLDIFIDQHPTLTETMKKKLKTEALDLISDIIDTLKKKKWEQNDEKFLQIKQQIIYSLNERIGQELLFLRKLSKHQISSDYVIQQCKLFPNLYSKKKLTEELKKKYADFSIKEIKEALNCFILYGEKIKPFFEKEFLTKNILIKNVEKRIINNKKDTIKNIFNLFFTLRIIYLNKVYNINKNKIEEELNLYNKIYFRQEIKWFNKTKVSIEEANQLLEIMFFLNENWFKKV